MPVYKRVALYAQSACSISSFVQIITIQHYRIWRNSPGRVWLSKWDKLTNITSVIKANFRGCSAVGFCQIIKCYCRTAFIRTNSEFSESEFVSILFVSPSSFLFPCCVLSASEQSELAGPVPVHGQHHGPPAAAAGLPRRRMQSPMSSSLSHHLGRWVALGIFKQQALYGATNDRDLVC